MLLGATADMLSQRGYCTPSHCWTLALSFHVEEILMWFVDQELQGTAVLHGACRIEI
jgi:hypothetical protein